MTDAGGVGFRVRRLKAALALRAEQCQTAAQNVQQGDKSTAGMLCCRPCASLLLGRARRGARDFIGQELCRWRRLRCVNAIMAGFMAGFLILQVPRCCWRLLTSRILLGMPRSCHHTAGTLRRWQGRRRLRRTDRRDSLQEGERRERSSFHIATMSSQ